MVQRIIRGIPGGWQARRLLVLERDGYRCWYCGGALSHNPDPTLGPVVDHQVPVGRGGSEEMDNLVAACWQCNGSKHHMTVEEYREKLLLKTNVMKARTLLLAVLEEYPTPFDGEISKAIEWLQERKPLITFFGELVSGEPGQE